MLHRFDLHVHSFFSSDAASSPEELIAAAKKEFNQQALAYAAGRGLSMTASSDAHHASAVAVSFTHFELDDLNLADLLRAIRKGGTPEGHYLSMREAMKKQFGALFRPANRKPA